MDRLFSNYALLPSTLFYIMSAKQPLNLFIFPDANEEIEDDKD
jgi:hypothetical protein